MLSDSDSDLEFLSAKPTQVSDGRKSAAKTVNHTKDIGKRANSRQNARQQSQQGGGSGSPNAELTSSREALWEKAGENAILRKQLEKVEADHQRALGDIFGRQQRAREDHQREVEELQQVIERERVQRQFLLAELRSKSGTGPASLHGFAGAGYDATGALQTSGNGPVPAPGGGSRSDGSIATIPPVRRSAAATFGDGFALKKSRLTTSVDMPLQIGMSQLIGTHHASSESGGGIMMTGEGSDEHIRLSRLLMAHRAPGYTDTTLQLLYAIKTPLGGTVGQKLADSQTPSALIGTMLSLISSVPPSSECAPLLLSLMYDLLLRRVSLTRDCMEDAPRQLCELVGGWLRELAPLPKFDELAPLCLLRRQTVKLLTCVLYGLDVLLAIEWSFEVPDDLSRRILTCTQAPQICAMGIDLLTAQPSAKTPQLLSLILPRRLAQPTVELLFSNLSGIELFTAAKLSRNSPYSSKMYRLTESLTELSALAELAEKRAESEYQYAREASLRLAQAMLDSDNSSLLVDQYVLSLLSSEIDHVFVTMTPVADGCVFYFWCRDHVGLRDNLDQSQLAELEVCLTKLVYARGETGDTVIKARHLLQVLTSSEDVDRLCEAFAPYEDEVSLMEAMS